MTIVVQEKKWFQSKTVWINLLGLVGGVLVALSQEASVAGGTLSVYAIINIVLRGMTKSPLNLN